MKHISAESEDIQIKKDTQHIIHKKEIDVLKRINNGVYTDTFGENFNCSFFYLYLYNLVDNTVKYVGIGDMTCVYYNPQFIDETSFICLAYKIVPYRLGLFAFNTRPNYLMLCKLHITETAATDKYNKKLNKLNNNHVKCTHIKLSNKDHQHVSSPIVIKGGKNIYIGMLVIFAKPEDMMQHISEYNLLLVTLADKNEIINKDSEKKKNKIKHKKIDENTVSDKQFDNVDMGDEIYQKSGSNFTDSDIEDVISEYNSEDYNSDKNDDKDGNINNNNNNNNNNNGDSANYTKMRTSVIIRKGEYTPFFRGLYTDEIKGYCYPYIFLNTIFYCNKIVIGVNMFTKKKYKVLIDDTYNETDTNTSIELLAVKNNNLIINIENMLINNVLVYCLFLESKIKGNYIYLTNLRTYNLDFTNYKQIKKEKYIIYSSLNDYSNKLFLVLSEMETSLFEDKHPYIRRKNPSFNLLYESEDLYLQDVKEKQLKLPNFNLFNKNKKRNLIIFLHGGPYSITRNEYKNIFIFLSACGFDILCINYIGSLTYSNTPNILNGAINTIEVDDVMNITRKYLQEFTDYEHTYLFGGSYGASLSCSIITKYNLFKSCCLFNGAYEFILSAYSSDVTDYFFNICLNKYNSYDHQLNSHDYAKICNLTPLNFVDNIDTPVLIICGKNDKRVTYHNSVALYNRLRSHNKKSKLFLFEQGTHTMDNMAIQETMLINLILWFYGYNQKQ
uniref:Protein dopey homolog PFC0245c-like n=1 Tax=Piliocolobus tephrosceles TaxID=591936 RepID=A0A8C9LIC9_9PRIM